MKYLSVCSGIEAATVAWHPLGWSPVAFSEIETFPSAVLDHHYPQTPNLGDMERFHEWPESNVDVLVGGTPCQSFSVAGLRTGLDDPRGNLTLVYLAIAERYRPRWIVWENVPGVLSWERGRAMGALLGGLAKLGYGFAYRVLDAQFYGLAQRRKRVFVVGYLGDWRPPAGVLFEPESLRRDPSPGRESREGAAGGAPSSAGVRSGERAVTAHSLNASSAGRATEDGTGRGCPIVPSTAHALTGEGFDASEDGTGRGTPLVPQTAQCLNAGAMGRQDAETETLIPSSDVIGEIADPVAANQGRTYTREGTHNFRLSNVAMHGMAVRRLTPRECERLQGFPDDYTLIPYRGKWAKDGPRYRALGNSMAVPVMEWIGRRIQLMEDVLGELGQEQRGVYGN